MRPGMRPIDSGCVRGCVVSTRDESGMRSINKECIPSAPHPSLVFAFTVQNTPVSGARMRDASRDASYRFGMRPGCVLSIWDASPSAPHPSLVFAFTVQNTPVSGARMRDASGDASYRFGMRPGMRPIGSGCVRGCVLSIRDASGIHPIDLGCVPICSPSFASVLIYSVKHTCERRKDEGRVRGCVLSIRDASGDASYRFGMHLGCVLSIWDASHLLRILR